MLVTCWQNWREAADFAGFWLRVSWDSCTWNWTCTRYIVTCLKFCIHRGKYWTSSMSWRLTSYRLKITQGNPGVHTPSNGLYGEALFERSTFFMLPAGIWEGRKICHFHPATKRFSIAVKKSRKLFSCFVIFLDPKESAFVAVERDVRSWFFLIFKLIGCRKKNSLSALLHSNGCKFFFSNFVFKKSAWYKIILKHEYYILDRLVSVLTCLLYRYF